MIDYFVLSDAFMLNSLCEMFGLLDSVKQTLDLRRSQNEDSKIHNSIYGEKAAEGNIQCTYSDVWLHCNIECGDFFSL